MSFSQRRGSATAPSCGVSTLPTRTTSLSVPLPWGALVSAVVPPLRGVRFASPLGPLFSPTGTTEPDPLTLVPVRPGDPVTLSDRVSWVRSPRGWHGEVGLTYPDALFQAHYRLDLSSPLLLFARSTLLLTANVTLFGLLWMLGRILRHARRPAWTEWRGLFVSFRARVTLALFAFFLLSNAILGTLAYRALTDAAERTAQVLAERVALDAAGFYQEVRGEMDLLARRGGRGPPRIRGGRSQGRFGRGARPARPLTRDGSRTPCTRLCIRVRR